MLKSKLTRLHRASLHDSTLDLELGGSAPVGLAEKSGSGLPAPESSVPAVLIRSRLASRLRLLLPVLVSVALSIIGQLILKRGMSDLGPVSLTSRSILDILWSIGTNPFVVVGTLIFAGSVLCWLIGLSRVQLSYAYPFISLSYVVILAASYFILGEQLSLLRIAGVGVIFSGVLLVAFSNPGTHS